MRDQDCIDFLLWALPRLGLRWPGYRKVRGTVCKRITRRICELCLADLEAYRSQLEADPAEWARLDAMCRNVNSLPTVTPFSRPIVTPLGVQE